MINPKEVDTLFCSCLFTEEELGGNPSSPPDGAICVEGILANFGLHPGRVKAATETIVGWLKQLPKGFRKDSGGGWSFLNACNTEDGELWTGEHRSMDQLFCLGQAIGKAQYLMPRDMWSSFPCGMPYVVIDV